ncbi:putative Ribosome biogenesis protein brx1 [Blattamonas nauphoetae]|uniref:Ribosome biogenesis protein brx1 n=1 Tax=Blattamonas nauphoetae TaxID=2049346 RepID=A0ABQ9Y463_9EUKA|nr:putative Ribosome biogenesis protein brx1 [Blattamonas nauphoetae]
MGRTKETKADRKGKKVVVFSSRGIGAKYRYLMKDLRLMLPHSLTEPKMENKDQLKTINEICQHRGSSGCIFFEIRKRTDLYIWMSVTPNGPCAKFQVYNVHTMQELQLTGNHMLNSRPILSFDGHFDALPQLKLLKELFTQLFAPPTQSPKVVPYVDHIYSFFYADEKIWFRHYQIVEKQISKELGKTGIEITDDPQAEAKASDDPILVEIGPRFVLDPIRIFSESFSGETLWKNAHYVSPTQIRAKEKAAKGLKYVSRLRSMNEHQRRQKENKVAPDPVDEIFME